MDEMSEKKPSGGEALLAPLPVLKMMAAAHALVTDARPAVGDWSNMVRPELQRDPDVAIGFRARDVKVLESVQNSKFQVGL